MGLVNDKKRGTLTGCPRLNVMRVSGSGRHAVMVVDRLVRRGRRALLGSGHGIDTRGDG